MTEEKLREKLKEIEELSVRQEIREIYQTVFRELTRYQEERLQKLEEQIQKSVAGFQVDYGVDLFLATHEDSRKWEDVCSSIDETRIYPLSWEQQPIKKVYLELSKEQLYKLEREKREFRAYVRTNYETYSCKVALQENTAVIEYIEIISEMLDSNGADLPKLSVCYATRFKDVVYTEQKDRLRADEQIEAVEIDWEELTPYIKEDVVLLCNVKSRKLKERVFPVPEQTQMRYRHELIPWKAQYAYIVDVSQLSDYEIRREENGLIIKTTQKQYKSWDVYEIVPRSFWEKGGTAQYVLSNRIKPDIIDCLKGSRKNTKAEIYRRILSYEAAAVFNSIEVLEKEIIFRTNHISYVEEACMEMILDDLTACYCGVEITGRLIKE